MIKRLKKYSAVIVALSIVFSSLQPVMITNASQEIEIEVSTENTDGADELLEQDEELQAPEKLEESEENMEQEEDDELTGSEDTSDQDENLNTEAIQNISNQDINLEEELAKVDLPEEPEDYVAIDEDGNVTIIPFEEIETANDDELQELNQIEYQITQETYQGTEIIDTVDTLEEAEKIAEEIDNTASRMTRAMKNPTDVAGIVKNDPVSGIVVFKQQSSNLTVPYFNAITGKTGYTSGYMAPDAAYVGKTSDGKYVIFKAAGIYGMVLAENVYVMEYADFEKKGYITQTYTVSNGYIYHKLTTDLEVAVSSICVGYAPSYMKSGTTYYSYDGHYFYTDYDDMISDYGTASISGYRIKEGTYSKAVNSNNPYYNYYQFLSHRSVSKFSASELNSYISSKTSSLSKLYNTGDLFINHQNTYGVNASLMLGVAINESAWGNSALAKEKNNLFGHNAVDSNPSEAANMYPDVNTSIKEHAEYYMSLSYTNPKKANYTGPHLGDKESGANVKYASDPYWGEKAASHCYGIERMTNGTQDYGSLQVGLLADEIVSLYKEPNTTQLYTTSSVTNVVRDVPVIVLGTVSSGGKTYYKIQSDGVLTSNRTAVNTTSGLYDFSRDYVYVDASKVTMLADFGNALPTVSYQTHVQSIGWQDVQSNGAVAGTSGLAKRLEAIKINVNVPDISGSVEYRTHIQTIGWQDWKKDGAMSGTSNESKRLEAIQIKLSGNMANEYDIYYRVHAEKFGWMGWTKNGQSAGTAGYSYRLEAIEIRLVEKGDPAPTSSNTNTTEAFKEKIVTPEPDPEPVDPPSVGYQTHVQKIGWQSMVYNGALAGTSGQALRMESMKIQLGKHSYSGGIQYRSHIQTYGWEDTWNSNGALTGTTGEAKRLEAIQIQLTGDMAKHYDVYYSVHAQTYGWLGWAKNGESAGSAGYAKRLEAIKIVVVPKGSSAPGSTANAFIQK